MEQKTETIESLSQLTPKAAYQKMSLGQLDVRYDFTESELRAIHELSSKIDVMDSTAIMNYGADAQNALSKFTSESLSQHSTHELGEGGDALATLVVNLKTFNPKDEPKNPIMKWISKAKKEIAQAQAEFSSVEDLVNQTEKIFQEKHICGLKKAIQEYDEMYDLNKEFYKRLTMYIAAGKERIEELRSTELVDALAKAKETGSAIDAEIAHDKAEAINNFEVKVFNLEMSRQIAMLQFGQIRLTQKNYVTLADEMQQILLTGVPLWRMQLRLHLGIEDAKEATNAIEATNSFTQQLLISTAEGLKDATIQTDELASKPQISIDVARKCNEAFIETLQHKVDTNLDRIKYVRENEGVIQELEDRRREAMIDFSVRMAQGTVSAAMTNTSDIYQPQMDRTPKLVLEPDNKE